MNRFTTAAVMALTLLGSSPALGEGVRGKQSAPNGVVLETFIDDFAGRAEFSSPSVEFKLPGQYMDSLAFVSKVKTGGTWGPTRLVVLVYYRGDWRFYSSAIFKGGESAAFQESRRDVVSCSGSRYGGCSHMESMYVTVTPEQLAKYAENGSLQIQIGARQASGSLVTVPAAYFDALNSLSSPAEVSEATPSPKTSESAAVASASQPPSEASSPRRERVTQIITKK